MKNRILLWSLLLACICVQKVDAQEERIVPFNGVVTDLTGTPLRRVKVYVLDANYAAKTDKQGRFGLTNVRPTDTLHVVYQKVHYDIPVEGRKSMRIRLGDQLVQRAEEDQNLVDIGYGFVSKREQLTPSNGISGEVLRRTGETNLLRALTGLVPGLHIRSTGEPSAEPSVSIRGTHTLHCSNEPLYVVDGIIVNTLDYISIYDVESVEIMKEASIYGSRGANGAILVHTKHGK